MDTAIQDRRPAGFKRNRSFFSPSQIKQMEDTFDVFPFPDREQIQKMSQGLNIGERSLQVWFQNRRARQRKATIVGRRYPTNLKKSFASNIPQTSLHEIHPNLPISIHTSPKAQEHNTQEIPKSTSPSFSEQKESNIAKSWHTHGTTDESVTPVRIEDCHVQWASQTSKKRKSSGSNVPTSKSPRTTDVEKIQKEDSARRIADDYRYMQTHYHQVSDSVLDLSSSSNSSNNKTPSPKSNHTRLSPEQVPNEHSPLNLCTRKGSSGRKVKTESISRPSPVPVRPIEMYPNYASMYGYPSPGMQCYPHFAFSPFYPPPFPMPPVGKYEKSMNYFPFPFHQSTTKAEDLSR